MQLDDIKNVTVVGAGLMGSGIAQEFAMAGYNVSLYDINENILKQAKERIKANLTMLAAFDLATNDDITGIPSGITALTYMTEAVGEADLIVEAVLEDIEVKQKVFAQLDALCPKRTILTSTTSTIKPDLLASVTNRPDKVMVTHFGIPNYLIPLVEMARGEQTSDETVDIVYKLLEGMGKRPVVMKKPMTGFIANRLQMAMLREAMNMVEQGAVTPEDIDVAVQNNFGLRYPVSGPLEVFDMAGLNTLNAVYSYIMSELSNSTEVPTPIREAVERGDFGVATGKGFFDWTPDSTNELRRRVIAGLADSARKRAEGQ